jgi:RNA polymerase sigma-32 factor
MAIHDSQKTKSANSKFMSRAMGEKLLTLDQETTAATAWREHQNEQALHTLITAHERLAIAIAHKFRHYGLPVSDLIQEGMIGLIEAANRFDATRGVRFATYATWWVRATIQDYILRNLSIVRLGSTAQQKSLFFNLRKLRSRIDSASDGASNAHQTRTEIASALNVSVQDVEDMEQRLGAGDKSLDTPIDNSSASNDNHGTEWIALLTDNRPNPEDIVIGMRDAETRSQWLNEALGTLSERERTIIKHRHLSEHAKTLEELGIALGVSKERVRQIEHRAMEKLHDVMQVHA